MRYTVRIELHDADWDDYELLHKRMAAEGFKTQITFGETTYNLPPAEYTYSGEIEGPAVLKKCEAAATGTRKRFGILVTQSAQRWQSGLEPA